MTFIEKFEYLKKNYASKVNAKKFTDNFIAIQVTLTDNDCGGTFYAAYTDGNFFFEPYDYHDNTAAVDISSKTLQELLDGKKNATEEYAAGNISIQGDSSHALQLIDAIKKTASKEKKETAACAKDEKKEKAKNVVKTKTQSLGLADNSKALKDANKTKTEKIKPKKLSE